MEPSPVPSDDKPELKEILENTKQVTQWKLLGIELGIESTRMQIIAEECRGNIEQCKMEMFIYWLRSDVDPTWMKLIEALENRNYNFVATMRKKLGIQGRRNPRLNLTLMEVQDRFTKLRKSLGAAITNHMANAKAVINILSNLPASYCEEFGTPLFPQALLPRAPSVRQVTTLINNFSSFLSCSLIDYCIQEVVKGREQLDHQLQDYTSMLEDFVSTTTLASFLQQSDGSRASIPSLSGTQLVQIGLGEVWRDKSIKQMMVLIDSLVCDAFPRQGLVFQFMSPGKNCLVETTWLTSTNIVSSFVSTTDGQKSTLREKGIMRITIGEISILDVVPTPYPRKQRSQSCKVTPHSDELITSGNESVDIDSVFHDECDSESTQEQLIRPVPKPRKRTPRATRQSWRLSSLILNPSYMAPKIFSLSEENQQHLSKEFYCQTCSKYLSAMWLASGEHQNHNLIPAEENAPHVLQQLTLCLEENSRTEIMAGIKVRHISQVLKKIDQAYSAASQNIEQFFANVRQKAEHRKQELIKAAMALKLETTKKTSETRNKLIAITENCKTLKEHQLAIMESLQAHSSTGVLWATDCRKLVCQMQQDLQSCNVQMKEAENTTQSVCFHGDVAMLERRFEDIGCYSTACRSSKDHHSVMTAAAQPKGLSNQIKPLQFQGDGTSEKTPVKDRPLPPTPLESHVCQNLQEIQPVKYEVPLTQSYPPRSYPTHKEQQMVSSVEIPEKFHPHSSSNHTFLYSKLNHNSPSQAIAGQRHPLPVVLETSGSVQPGVLDSLGEKPVDTNSQTQNANNSELHYYSIIDTVEEEYYMPHGNREPIMPTSGADPYCSIVDVENGNLYKQPDEEEACLSSQPSESRGSSSSYISMISSVQPYLLVAKDQLTRAASSNITPIGVCCAGDGHVAFTTSEDSFIRFLDQSGTCTDQFISCSALLPHTLATLSIDGDLGIGVITKESGAKCQIQVFCANGTKLQEITLPDLETPGGMTMNSTYQIYVSQERGSICKISFTGEVLQKIEIPTAGKLGGLIVTEHGSMIVTDKMKNCLWIVDKNGGNIRMIGEQFLLGPCNIFLTADNKHIIVIDKIDHTVVVFNKETEKVQATFGGKGSNPGEFKSPQGVCRRSDGSLVIADTANQRLQIFSAADITKYILSSSL